MERVLITGVGGFMGSHLSEFLLDKVDVYGTYFKPTTDITNVKCEKEECDIRDRKKVKKIIKKIKPGKIYHLAAQSYPKISWEDPWYTIETNVIGTVNLFEAVKELGIECKILIAGSSAEYGYVKEEEVPVKENKLLKPLHPYGVSKVAKENLAYQYWKNFGIKSITIRIFNTTGPRKVNDVCSDFCKRAIEIEKGKRKDFPVGNLETKRAITDVRDTIEGFYLALEKGKVGEVYNLSGNKVYSGKNILEKIKNLTGLKFNVVEDKKLLRPSEEPVIFGDSSKFKKDTGWEQKIEIEKTLKDMLDWWRENV